MADETTKMNLVNDITVNGRVFRAGQGVEVPKAQADDVARLDYDHQQYKSGLMSKRTYEVDGGTIAAGGGAQ